MTSLKYFFLSFFLESLSMKDDKSSQIILNLQKLFTTSQCPQELKKAFNVADHDVGEAIKGKRSLNCSIAG